MELSNKSSFSSFSTKTLTHQRLSRRRRVYLDFLLKDDKKGWVTQINEYIAKMSRITEQIFSSSAIDKLLPNIVQLFGKFISVF